MRTVLLAFICIFVAGCTADRYIKEDGTEVTVKRFAGIPYLEEDVKTEIVPMGSAANPI